MTTENKAVGPRVYLVYSMDFGFKASLHIVAQELISFLVLVRATGHALFNLKQKSKAPL